MRFECEVVANEILPALRKIITERLSSDYGLTQEEIAGKLGLTQPAVSQYLEGKRARKQTVKNLQEDPQIDIILDEAVSLAAKDEDFSTEIGQIIDTSRDKGLFKEKFRDTKKCL